MKHFVLPIFVAAATILSTTQAHADHCDQLFKLLANDGDSGDRFGFSVGISGTTAIVGAQGNDDSGSFSGSAYLINTITGQQLFKLLAADGAEFDEFGFSVSISGTVAIVGAHENEENGPGSGAAYLFDTSTSGQIAKLLPDNASIHDHFGKSVGISGTLAIIGATSDDDNGNASGAAYLFDTTTGKQITKLLAEDGAEDDQFGHSVAISGPPGKEIAIVGVRLDDDNGSASGSAYLFDATTGKQTAKLLPKDGAAEDQFGFCVSISGNVAIVGAPKDDDNGDRSGAAYLFDVTTGKQIAKLLPNDGMARDQFGISVAINELTAIVGASFDFNNGGITGSAYLFDISDPANPRQIAKLLPNDGDGNDFFGWSVAISGATAIGGAYGDDDNGSTSGSAYIYDAAAFGNCLWDLDNLGSVGVSDLLALFASWGTCNGCSADFDCDGAVGESDLLLLLANWGPCE